jgi:hypothetical protein
MILIGLGIVVIALIDSPIQLQIILGLIGLGFIVLGLVVLKSQQGSRQLQDQMNTLMTKLDEIHQEVNQGEQSKGKGVIIADVLSSGLKYYSEHMAKQKKEEDSQ